MQDWQPTEDQFLGALLGMAIGDAVGRPFHGMTATQIRDDIGQITGFKPEDRDPDKPQGQITDQTEVALCLVESLTTNDGLLDPANINVRMGFLARGPSGELMSQTTRQGLNVAAEHDGLVAAEGDDPAELAVATRGVPIGLLHAVGGFDRGQFEADCATTSRLSHRGEAQVALLSQVAGGVRRAACHVKGVAGDFPDATQRDVDAIVAFAHDAAEFEVAVFGTVADGGDTDARGAIAGAIAGARVGASGIPQQLIDDLDARIYLSLAAPWFYRTAQRRAGTVIDLRHIDS